MHRRGTSESSLHIFVEFPRDHPLSSIHISNTRPPATPSPRFNYISSSCIDIDVIVDSSMLDIDVIVDSSMLDIMQYTLIDEVEEDDEIEEILRDFFSSYIATIAQ